MCLGFFSLFKTVLKTEVLSGAMNTVEEYYMNKGSISTSLHRQMQSIRFFLAFFGLAPAAGMNSLERQRKGLTMC